MIKQASIAATVFLGILSFAGLANAHAHLVSAVPPAGGTVAAAPTEIDLTFSEQLNVKFTGIKITGPDGAEVKVDSEMLMDGDKTLMATLKEALAPGSYKVSWHALSQDGHKSQGSYDFIVKK